MRQTLSRRTFLQVATVSPLGLASVAVAADTPATAPAKLDSEAKIRNLAAYYAKTYGQPLTSPDRLPREIAIISLSRINAPETTKKLLEVFKLPDRDPVIWYLAWEALHARVQSLDHDQRRGWVTAGLQAGLQGGFPGTTVIPLLRAMAEHSPVAYEDQPHRLVARVIAENDLDDPDQKATLDAARSLVAAWHDPTLIRSLIGQLGKPQYAARIEYVLRALPNPPAEGTGPKQQGVWAGWLEKSGLKVAGPKDLKEYKGKARVFPPPSEITDPEDRRWHAELELGKLVVTDFDLVWCIDSTGSMNVPNQTVASETAHVVRICSYVSRRARCGSIYARHETEQQYLKPCCQAAAGRPPWYQVKGNQLTTDAVKLAATMAAEKIPPPDKMNEGNVHPGTPVLSAMQAAVKQMDWSKDKGAKRVIVLVGDSPPTPGTEEACKTFAAQAKKDGFKVRALAIRRAVETWGDILKAAGGKMQEFEISRNPGMPLRPKAAAKAGRALNVFSELASDLVRDCVTPAYHDRVGPLVEILVGYARAAEKAEGASAVGKPGTK